MILRFLKAAAKHLEGTWAFVTFMVFGHIVERLLGGNGMITTVLSIVAVIVMFVEVIIITTVRGWRLRKFYRELLEYTYDSSVPMKEMAARVSAYDAFDTLYEIDDLIDFWWRPFSKYRAKYDDILREFRSQMEDQLKNQDKEVQEAMNQSIDEKKANRKKNDSTGAKTKG